MATESGLEVPALGLDPLERDLRADPTSFGFFQAVRLLERLRPRLRPVGEYGDPADEVVRFSANPSLAFPPAEIASLVLDGDRPARMSVNFMGLVGPLGVLPYYYTLLVAERRRERDAALAEFLDLFHHRIVSLFYRAWEKHCFAVGWEKDHDRLYDHFLDLVGAGLESAQRHLPMAPEALIHYAGLFMLQPRGAVALQQIIEDYFDIPAEIEQFIGDWFSLPVHDQCAIGEEVEVATQLGQGCVVGDEIWDQQSRLRIRLGPLSRSQFDEFLPTGNSYRSLQALTRFYCHDQFEFELQLVLARDDVPGFMLGADAALPQPLGWSTWIRSTAFADDADDTLLRL